MNNDQENWNEAHLDECRFFDSIKWINDKYPKVYDQFMKELEDHSWGLKHDEYYRYCCGGGTIPVPRCEYCINYDRSKEACTLEWNNLDPCYYVPDRDDRDPSDLCEHYEWDNEWEES